jgi:hypothetical protein
MSSDQAPKGKIKFIRKNRTGLATILKADRCRYVPLAIE